MNSNFFSGKKIKKENLRYKIDIKAKAWLTRERKEKQINRLDQKKLLLGSLSREWLTKSLRTHFGSPSESIGPLRLMHSSQKPSLVISPLQLPHTRKH